mmetsp:Transcript_876/g.1135  ORF Transcript_876/g.1135 Transcript_876/m.1135 type:complete len:1082 (+) Transcript_876:73-3318(+)
MANPYGTPTTYATPYASVGSSSRQTTIIGNDPETQQSRLLSEATRRVQEQAYYMRRGMDNDDLAIVLERASSMLAELGGTELHSHHHQPAVNLTPRSYYELHMRTTDEMPHLEEFLLSLSEVSGESNTVKFSMKELYEIVQYCPRVVPRLYLQICAGSALIRSGDVAVKDVLSELVEVVKSVQCPLRGLFLRSYLLQALKDKLPDVANPAEAPRPAPVMDFLSDEIPTSDCTAIVPVPNPSEREVDTSGGSLEDSYKFIILNFVEMNKLWCRIHHIPGERGNREVKKRRDKERHELRILVGTNLVRLSQLDGITPQIYKESILPKILEQITSCNDALAQAYLMDCVIQVFPDEFHLYTLQDFLSVCPKLKEKVNIRTILHSMMERLTNYVKGTTSGDGEGQHIITFDAFKLFEDCIRSTCEAKGANLAPREVIRMETALLNFSLKCYPGKLQHVNSCLGVCANALAKVQSTRKDPSNFMLDTEAVDELEKLLSIPLESLSLQVLELKDYKNLLQFLPWENWRQVGTVMLRAVNNSGNKLDNLQQIEELFAIMAPLLRDQNTNMNAATVAPDMDFDLDMNSSKTNNQNTFSAPNTPHKADHTSAEFKHEQTLVARLCHLFSSNDTDELFKMLLLAKKNYMFGGAARLRHTVPPLVFATLPLLFRIHKEEYSEEVMSMLALPPPPPPPGEEADGDGDLIDMTSGGDNATTADESKTNQGSDGNDNIAQEGADKKSAALDALLTLSVNDDAETTPTKDEPSSDPPEDAASVIEGKRSTSLLLDLGIFESGKPEDKIADNAGKLFDDEPDEPEAGDAGDVTSDQLFSSPNIKVITTRKVFLFLQKLIAASAQHCPELGFKLNLELSLTANYIATLTLASTKPPSPSLATPADFLVIAYEFMTHAFTIYENDITDSKAQIRAITAMIGTLLASRNYEKHDYESLITKTAQYGAKLLKKPDQCKMVTLCSHLFFTTFEDDTTNYRNPQRVLECLQRSLKIADACSMASPASVHLFIELLDHYVYYFENENPVITHKFVSGLIALIKEHLGASEDGSAAHKYFGEIVKYIQRKKMSQGVKERFAPIVC